MTVTLKCDLCGREHMLAPGDTSKFVGSSKGWDWYRPSPYATQVVITNETLCELCQEAIAGAKEKAELAIREQRKYP